MSRGRRVPTQPDEAAERRAALLDLDIAAVRAWAARHTSDDLNTIALADDARLLRSMHEARAADETMPGEARAISRLVLRSLPS